MTVTGTVRDEMTELHVASYKTIRSRNACTYSLLSCPMTVNMQ